MILFPTFKGLTINVRGLSENKFSSVVECFRRQGLDFCFVQETMISDKRVMDSFSSRWRGPIYWSPAVGRRGGVAVFLTDELRNKITCWKKDADGRVLSILLNCDGVRLNLVNVYAPTVPRQRVPFFQVVHSFFFPHSEYVVGGDFNCYDSPSDKFGGNVSISPVLSNFKSCFSLRDAWRALHPRDFQFTWFSPDLSVASRLDTFLVFRSFSSSVSSCDIAPCVFSDHDFVFISFDLGSSPRVGPGVWKINNSLLEDESFCEQIRALIDRFLLFKHAFISVSAFWESLKEDIKASTVSFSRQRRVDLSRQRVLLTNRLISAKRRLTSGDPSAKSEIVDLEVALRALISSESEGVKIRSRVKWLEEGEAPTRFFFKSATQKFEKSFVHSIFTPDGSEVSTLPEVIGAHETFYSALFAEEPVDSTVQEHLLSFVTRRLSEFDRELCEGALSLDEATDALKLSNCDKTPGPDGLSVEFYLTFWSRLGPLLVEGFNESLRVSELSDSMKSSVTRLVYKKDDKRCLKNWRPISLLNVDYKICSKAFSLRLSKVLESIIDPDQTCSVPGRSIVSNLQLIRDTLDFIDRTGETGILVSLDQEKAFDRVNRSFLLRLLEHLGFGPSFINCIYTLYNGANMRVIVNGFLSDEIPIRRGVRQGDSLSPMLYILCVEVLACKIRACRDIEGFLLPGAGGTHFKVGQYADDTTSLVKNVASLHNLFREVRLYELGTGAKLNVSKTEAMWLGAWRDRTDQPLGLTWVRKLKILGVVFGTVPVERDNWEPRLSKLDNSLSLWKSRSLSFVGKVLILNILGLSKFLYLSRVLIPPRWVFDRYNSLIWPFLWGARLETVARKSIVCPLDQGGLGLVDFKSKGEALRLSTLVKTLADPAFKCFYLIRYFCGSRLAPLRPEWSALRDNHTPSAALPTPFYVCLLDSLKSFNFPSSFSESKTFYKEILKQHSTSLSLPSFWSPILRGDFRLSRHWASVRDSFTENFKNDLLWLITLRAVKVRESLRNWGYIDNPWCASCPRVESIDHCFRVCPRVNAVWVFFFPLLSLLLAHPFPLCGASIFFFQLPFSNEKSRRLILFVVKSILYGVWRFRNKAVFHNGREDSRAIIKYIIVDIQNRIRVDHYHFSPNKFRSMWCHPALCDFHSDDNLIFKF